MVMLMICTPVPSPTAVDSKLAWGCLLNKMAICGCFTICMAWRRAQPPPEDVTMDINKG